MTNSIKEKIQKHKTLYEVVLLVIIFAISLLIRRIGLKFGFPLLTHPDEIYVFQGVLRMTSLHTWDPAFYAHPNQVLYYLNFIILNIISFLFYKENVYWAFQEHYLTFYTYGRLLIAIFGALIPVFAYGIGKEIKPKFALPTAIVFATFPLYIQYSDYIASDLPITLFTLIVLYFSLRFINTHQQKFLIFAAVFAAINTGEKYPGLLSLLIVLAAVALQLIASQEETNKEKIKKFILKSLKVGFIFIAALFIVAPYLFINLPDVIEALRYEVRTVHLGSDNLGWAGNFWFYVKILYGNIGILGFLLMFLGLFAMLRSWKVKYILLLYGFLYWISLSSLALHWERWSLPMHIAPLFLIAFGIVFLIEQKFEWKPIRILLFIVIGVFIFQQGTHAVYNAVRLKYTDTRVVASIYCEENEITINNSLYEGYTPLWPTYSKFLFSDFESGVEDYQYIVLSSSMYNRFYAEPEQYQNEIKVYDDIRDSFPLLKRFQPNPFERGMMAQFEDIIYFMKYRLGITDEIRYSGPTIEIYEISQ
jgi:hypothetical protein